VGIGEGKVVGERSVGMTWLGRDVVVEVKFATLILGVLVGVFWVLSLSLIREIDTPKSNSTTPTTADTFCLFGGSSSTAPTFPTNDKNIKISPAITKRLGKPVFWSSRRALVISVIMCFPVLVWAEIISHYI